MTALAMVGVQAEQFQPDRDITRHAIYDWWASVVLSPGQSLNAIRPSVPVDPKVVESVQYERRTAAWG